jgi:hypothetical protein
MRFLFILILILPSLNLHAISCPKKIEVTLETKNVISYCLMNNLKVSENCYNQKENCSLVKHVNNNRKLIEDAFSHASKQNPGSWACKQLGLEVIMGKTANGGDICTCQNTLGESVVCISLTY